MKMWRWLSDNKDSISAAATILQAAAVIVGVIFAVNEFVLKDRQAERERVDRAFEIFRGTSGFGDRLWLGDLIYEVMGQDDDGLKKIVDKEKEEIFSATIRAIQRYTELQTCLKTQTCDEPTVRHLFCQDAFSDSFVAYKIIIRPYSSSASYDTRLDNLFDFHLECTKQGYPHRQNELWNQRRSKQWDPVLGPTFIRLESEWRDAMQKSSGTSKKAADTP